MADKKKPEPKAAPCPQCGGRGVVAVGTEDFSCSNCDGTGKVKA